MTLPSAKIVLDGSPDDGLRIYKAMQEDKRERLIFERWKADKQAYDIANYMSGSKGKPYLDFIEYKKALTGETKSNLLTEEEKAIIRKQTEKINARLGVTK